MHKKWSVKALQQDNHWLPTAPTGIEWLHFLTQINKIGLFNHLSYCATERIRKCDHFVPIETVGRPAIPVLLHTSKKKVKFENEKKMDENKSFWLVWFTLPISPPTIFYVIIHESDYYFPHLQVKVLVVVNKEPAMSR